MKKIFLIIYILIGVTLPFMSAHAMQTYIGVQIDIASTISSCEEVGCTSDRNWCLPGDISSSVDGTQLTVMGGENCEIVNGGAGELNCSALSTVSGSGTTNPQTVGKNSPLCADSSDIIWSGLIDLEASTKYVLKLSTSSYCPGIVIGTTVKYCMVSGEENQNCIDTCAKYGLLPRYFLSLCIDNWLSDCAGIEALKRSDCTECNPSETHNYYDSSGRCYHKEVGGMTDCNAMGIGTFRVCDCSFNETPNSFYFYFTTPENL